MICIFLVNKVYSIPKDTVRINVSVKKLRSDMLSFDSIPYDTLLENMHQQDLITKRYVSFSYLGNTGLSAISNNYFERESNSNFVFFDALRYNFIHKEDILYYKTNYPYTNITYNTSASKSVDLQSIRFLHSQNVNKKLNFGMLLRLHGTNGLYQYQKSSANSMSLFSSYDGDYYSYNAVVSYNSLKNEENGGLPNDSLFENDNDKAAVFPISLSKANLNLRNSYMFLSQRFNLAGVRDVLSKQKDTIRRFSGIGLLHTLEFDRNKRKYTDALSQETVPGFYPAINIDSTQTNDSLYFFQLKNSLELLFGKQNPNEAPILLRAGIKSVYDKYSYSIKPDIIVKGEDTTINRYYRNYYNNLAFTGGISVGIKSFFLLNATADYFVTGYKAGDLYIHGKMDNKFSRRKGAPSFSMIMDLGRYKPGYFFDSYYSNHYQWDNGFIPIKDVRVGFDFSWPSIRFDADFNYALVSSPVYFDSIAIPRQYSGEVSVIEGSASKGFRAGIFHSRIKTLLQVTSNDKVVPVPLLSAFTSNYLEMKVFNKVMTLQVGFDARYNTSFYAYGYMPATSIFYNQRLKKIGNYPYLDAFLNVKLKRMRFYFKLDHVYANLLSRTYYTVLHYPMNSRVFLMGLTWNFYD